MSYTTPTARWRALTTRDPQANGQFVYTVKTTNVYCRPTCPARLARRANIGFFTYAHEAATAGFRACKRCKPESDVFEDSQGQAVNKACNLIDEAIKSGDLKALRLRDLAKNVGLTSRYFHKVFKDRMAMTPKEYVKVRMVRSYSDALNTSGVDSAGNVGFAASSFDISDFDFSQPVDLDWNLFPLPSAPPPVDWQALDLAMSAMPSLSPESDMVTPPTTAMPEGIDFDSALSSSDPTKNFDIPFDTNLLSGFSYPDSILQLPSSTFEMDAAFLASNDIFLPQAMETARMDDRIVT